MKLRKGFISVVFAVALCLSMGVGASVAWADDSFETTVNNIQKEYTWTGETFKPFEILNDKANVEGEYEASAAKWDDDKYVAYITPTGLNKWDNGTQETRKIEWTIKPASTPKPASASVMADTTTLTVIAPLASHMYYIEEDYQHNGDIWEGIFYDLEPGTEYKVAVYKVGDSNHYNSPTVYTTIGTDIEVSGTVTGKDLPEKVILTPKKGGVVIKIEVKDGKYRMVVPYGDYTLTAIGKDGLQSAEIQNFAAKAGSANVKQTIEMSNTTKGDAKDFIDQYLTDDQGNVITEVTADNYAKVVAAQKALESLSADAQKLVKQQMGSLFDATTAAADAADNFITENLADADGNVITQVTEENYKQVLDAKAKWDQLNDVAKAMVIEKMKPLTFYELLTAAEEQEKTLNDTADKFIKDNLTDANGNVITKATADNYKQILAAKAKWDQLSDAEKAAINAKLAPNTFEDLLKQAQAEEEAQATTGQEKAAKDKLAKTGDSAPVLPLALIALTSLGVAGVAALRKKNAA